MAYPNSKLAHRALQSLLGLLLCFDVVAEGLCTPEEEEIALAHAMYHEARGSEVGMRSVGHVILNRYDSPRFPDTICGVVYQPSNNPDLPKKCAFSFTCDGLEEATLEVEAYRMAEKVAKNLLSGYYHLDTSLGALYYYHCNLHMRDKWMYNLRFLIKHGRHCFYD